MEWLRDTGKSTAHLGDGRRRRRLREYEKIADGVMPICQFGVISSILVERTIQLQSIGDAYPHQG